MSFDKFLTKVFGSSNQRFLKSIQPLVEQINAFEPSMQALSDDELRARTAEFKERVQKEVAGTTDKEERKRRERAALQESRGTAVGAESGLVKLKGEVWSARSFDPHHTIEAGRHVDVVQIDGATAVVYESEI